jgi:hypothetical protein
MLESSSKEFFSRSECAVATEHQLLGEMLKNSLHGIFQLGSSRSEFATASANQRLTSLLALGHPCPNQEALI